MHEAKSNRFNTWITLTYDDEHLPDKYHTGLVNPKTKQPIYSGNLVKEEIPKFIRRIRKALGREKWEGRIHHQNGVRYYYAGEYGELYNRPHYHACLFGIEFADKKIIKTTNGGFKLYESKTLNELWPYGNHMIGDLTHETAAYTARYIMKKINGKQQKKHYEKINAETGEIINTEPEFNGMSTNPGIGNEHFQKYKKDYYRETESGVRVKGYRIRTPRYYDKLYERDNPQHLKNLKFARIMDMREKWENHTPARLKAGESIIIAATTNLRGNLK